MADIVKLPTPALLSIERVAELLVQARTLVAASVRIDEVREIHDRVKMIASYLRSQRAALEVQNDAAEVVIWARRRIGELSAEVPRTHGPGRGKERQNVPGKGATLVDLGIDPREARRCEQLAEVPDEKLRRHIANVRTRAEKLTLSGTIAAVSHGEDYDSDQWYTPPELIADARTVLGEIDLDPASCKVAQRTVRAAKFYTAEDDGLGKPWKGRVWCNPPYSQPLCSRFVAKFIDEASSGRMAKGIILLNASTDTAWWHSLAERFPVCFTRGRLAFLDACGEPVKGNRVGQVIFAHGCGRNFATVFARHGLVLQVA